MLNLSVQAASFPRFATSSGPYKLRFETFATWMCSYRCNEHAVKFRRQKGRPKTVGSADHREVLPMTDHRGWLTMDCSPFRNFVSSGSPQQGVLCVPASVGGIVEVCVLKLDSVYACARFLHHSPSSRFGAALCASTSAQLVGNNFPLREILGLVSARYEPRASTSERTSLVVCPLPVLLPDTISTPDR